jgi:hypothetical protein
VQTACADALQSRAPALLDAVRSVRALATIVRVVAQRLMFDARVADVDSDTSASTRSRASSTTSAAAAANAREAGLDEQVCACCACDTR